MLSARGTGHIRQAVQLFGESDMLICGGIACSRGLSCAGRRFLSVVLRLTRGCLTTTIGGRKRGKIFWTVKES